MNNNSLKPNQDYLCESSKMQPIQTLRVVILAILLDYVYCGAIRSEHPCKNKHYYDQSLEKCRPCGGCPVDQVVITPCGLFNDVHCGPLNELLAKFGFRSNKEISKKKQDAPVTRATSTEAPVQPETEDTVTVGMFQISKEWYLISMILLGVLCFVCVALTVYIILACFVCKKRRNVTDKVIDHEYVTPLNIEACLSSGPNTSVLTTASGNLYLNYTYIEPKDSLNKIWR